jgi:hypothetical protein
LIKLQKTIEYTICAGITSIVLAGAMPAQAASLVSTFRPPGTTTSVGTIDPDTGTVGIFNTNIQQLTDIAVNTSNEVFGITYDQLYRINTGNNGRPMARNLGITGAVGLAFDSSNNLYAIAGCNATRGCGNGNGNPGFYSINTSTGVATLIGGSNTLGAFTPTAFSPGGDAGDLVFDPTNNRFLATSGNTNSILFSIALDGTTAQIGNGTGFNNVSGLSVSGGNLYGYTTTGQQIQIDSLTGLGFAALNLTGTNNAIIGGAASLPTELIVAREVPEPSFAPGLLTTVGGLFGARYLLKRKKQQKQLK